MARRNGSARLAGSGGRGRPLNAIAGEALGPRPLFGASQKVCPSEGVGDYAGTQVRNPEVVRVDPSRVAAGEEPVGHVPLPDLDWALGFGGKRRMDWFNLLKNAAAMTF